MTRAEILHKLLRLGPMEPLHTQAICGWPADEFERALRVAVQNGWVRRVRHTNQYATHLEAA